MPTPVRQSTVYSASVRVELNGRDSRVVIFGDIEHVRLLHSYLTARIAGLVKEGEENLDNAIGVISYEDTTGLDFTRKAVKGDRPNG